MSDRYSVISNLDDLTCPKPIVDKWNKEKESRDQAEQKPIEDQFDYSNIPESEVDFLRQTIRSFSNVLSVDEDDRKIIRDSRHCLELRMETEPNKPRMFSADAHTAKIIDNCLRDLVKSGVARYTRNPHYFSPVCVKIRGSQELALMREARAAGEE
jgi:hypothetical protein